MKCGVQKRDLVEVHIYKNLCEHFKRELLILLPFIFAMYMLWDDCYLATNLVDDKATEP